MLTLVVAILCIVVGYSARSVVRALERRNVPNEPTENPDEDRIALLERRLADFEFGLTEVRAQSHSSKPDSKKADSRLQSVEEIMGMLSHDSRMLIEAIKRIDPKAIRTSEQIRSYDEAAQERYGAHAMGERHWSDFEPSVQRLENEILKITQEVQGLRETKPRN